MADEEEYIGDGVYVSGGGYELTLRAPRLQGDQVIYLDPDQLGNLMAYAAKNGSAGPAKRALLQSEG
ncbi:hypothetical protein LOC51_00695 [Rubrivivax sp. JA1024]|nr:hypothetical protein [Rubrivivax sp. JA1024]